jgi:peroxin-10
MSAGLRFLYYAATTLSGYQTLGEEYSGLIQIVASADRVRMPSLPRRFLMVFLQTFGPKILAAALARAEKHLNDEKLSLGM